MKILFPFLSSRNHGTTCTSFLPFPANEGEYMKYHNYCIALFFRLLLDSISRRFGHQKGRHTFSPNCNAGTQYVCFPGTYSQEVWAFCISLFILFDDHIIGWGDWVQWYFISKMTQLYTWQSIKLLPIYWRKFVTKFVTMYQCQILFLLKLT